MTKEQIIGVLAEYAVGYAKSTTNTHAEDIANDMSIAIEHGGGLLTVLKAKGLLK